MTNRKTSRPEANDPLPLDTDKIHEILRSGVLDIAHTLPGLIDDLIQDAWVALLARRDRLVGVHPDALPAYLRKMARSSTIDRLRSLRADKRGGGVEPVRPDDLSTFPGAAPDPERTALAREALRRTVRRAAGPRLLSRQILALLFLDGLSPAATARCLDISIDRVYSAVYRGRARLARQAASG